MSREREPAATESSRVVLVFPNERERLESARSAVRRHLEAHAVDGTARHAVDLVLEEIGSNVLSHGYERGQRGEIAVELAFTPALVQIAITDDARAFDPTSHPEPRRVRSLREAPDRGRGISMVRRIALALRYRREDGRNRLEVDVARAAAS